MNSLREKIDAQVVKEYLANKHTPQDYWRISGVGNPFAAYHRRLGSKVDLEVLDPESPEYADACYKVATSELVMKLGTTAHDMLNGFIERSEGLDVLFIDHKDYSAEERFEVVDKELNAIGHPDLAIGDTLYDFKSVNSGAFDRMKKEGGGRIKPYDHHIQQITKYFDLVTKKFPQVKNMRLVYFDRDNMRREEIPVEFDPIVLAVVDEEFKFLNSCWETKTPPPPPPANSWMANPRYADYTHLMPYKNESNI